MPAQKYENWALPSVEYANAIKLKLSGCKECRLSNVEECGAWGQQRNGRNAGKSTIRNSAHRDVAEACGVLLTVVQATFRDAQRSSCADLRIY